MKTRKDFDKQIKDVLDGVGSPTEKIAKVKRIHEEMRRNSEKIGSKKRNH